MGTFKDLTGKKFGRLTVIERDQSKHKHDISWICLCECGNTTSVAANNLRNGHTQSCGCLRAETEAARFVTPTVNRKENPRLYSIWKSMKARCYRERHSQYSIYGGRGIRICEEWLGESGFSNFVKWAKENGYSEELTIDRIDVDGNYNPSNCRWITFKENQNNKRDNRYIKCNGEVKTLSQWADYCGIHQATMKHRLDVLDLPIEIAIKMSGLPRVEYKGKMYSIGWLSRKYNIDYKTFLHEVLINGKGAEEIIAQYT